MVISTNGSARVNLPVELESQRQLLETLLANGTLVVDSRRRRPKYFDGRFLTARDLTRDQNYFLTRQGDIGRAGGTGVVTGLLVTHNSSQSVSALTVTAGYGVTPSGELVLLSQTISIQLTDIPEIERLNAAFNLTRIPAIPARNRNGVFVVALRPVEFTANPIASYPTSITGTRSVEDGDIIEAVVVTLIPYPEDGSEGSANLRRAQIAQEIFALNAPRGLPVNVLPLALVYVERNVIQWVDPFLIRREVGADHGDILGLGFAPRAVREAHLIQYESHLNDVMADRAAHNLTQRFAANEYFRALPPGGRMPAAAIDPRDFTHIYFPPEMDVDLSLIAEDEVAAMLEESLLLPPIDLMRTGTEQESISVLILIPVSRARLRELKTALTTVIRPLKPAAVGLIAKRRPLQVLTGLRLARRDVLALDAAPSDTPPADSNIDARWRQELASAETLWYIRRRNFAYSGTVTGEPLKLVTPTPEQPVPPVQPDDRLKEFLDANKLTDRFASATSGLDPDSVSRLSDILTKKTISRATVEDANIFAINLLATVTRLKEASGGVIKPDELSTMLKRFNRTTLGNGILQLKSVAQSDGVRRAIAESDSAIAFDLALIKRAAASDGPAFLEALDKRLLEAKPEEVNKLITAVIEGDL